MKVVAWLFKGLVVAAFISSVWLISFKWNDPASPNWVALDEISTPAKIMVMAAEDNRFCIHNGFDFDAIEYQIRVMQNGGRPAGGSTISQQTVKNALLWNDRSWLRKGLEAWFTPQAEFFWGKKRILELYLNIADFGPGVRGIEQASQKFFNKPASELTYREAAQLAVVLPAPTSRIANKLSPTLQRQARVVEQRQTYMLGNLIDCIL